MVLLSKDKSKINEIFGDFISLVERKTQQGDLFRKHKTFEATWMGL